jgi:hypothetical protein
MLLFLVYSRSILIPESNFWFHYTGIISPNNSTGDQKMKKFCRMTLLFALVLLSLSLVNAQGKQASLDAFNKWRAGEETKAGTTNITFQGVAVAVQLQAAGTVTVNFAVGTSLDLNGVPALTFIAQPVTVTKNGIEEAGKSGKIRSSAIERAQDSLQEVVFTPQIVLPGASQANAVKITVQGFEGNPQESLTLIIPIGTATKTSVLGRVQIKSSESRARSVTGS